MMTCPLHGVGCPCPAALREDSLLRTEMAAMRMQTFHVSEHFGEGKKGTHAIASIIKAGGAEIVSFTDADRKGNVGESGFDDKVK